MDQPNIGVELASGTPWVGVDQQVGHGSADALYALPDGQYEYALAEGWLDGTFRGECWHGEHPDRLLFSPAGGGFKPEQWHPGRNRQLAYKFRGEIWRHIDALGEPVASEQAEISRRLAADSATVTIEGGLVSSLVFQLDGKDGYPRPGAIIGGLSIGSTLAQAQTILGTPVTGLEDEFVVEGTQVRLGFEDGGLKEVAIAYLAGRELPAGQLGTFLSALGAPEEGPAFQALSRLTGGRDRRWELSSGTDRRRVDFEGGVSVQVEDDRVLSVRIEPSRLLARQAVTGAPELIPGVTWPTTRAQIHEALGAPAAQSGSTDLHLYGQRELLVEYGIGTDQSPLAITAILRGIAVNHEMQPARSGNFTMFLDVLGRVASNPLVAYVRGLRGVQVRMQGKGAQATVTEVKISQGFADFLDGLPADPVRTDFPFGAPAYYADNNDVWSRKLGWIQVHCSGGARIIAITVSKEFPTGLAVKPWRYGRDSMDAWRALGKAK